MIELPDGLMGAAVPVVAAYLIGSISFSYLIVLLIKGIDIRTVGSGNAGATNVLRATGTGPAALALLLDIGKGVAAVVLARALGATPWVTATVGVAVVVGHIYPIYFGFRGGKGVATAGGTLGTLAPVPMSGALVVFVVLVAWKRYVSLGSIGAAVAAPVAAIVGEVAGWYEAGEGPALIAAALSIGSLIVIKHRENIERLRTGTEKKLGQRLAT